MNGLIVTCAACGQPSRGKSNGKKYKCSGCANILTFPAEPVTSGPGRMLCSFCWTDMERRLSVTHCAGCSQRVDARYGGKAVAIVERGGVNVEAPPELVVAQDPPPPLFADVGGTEGLPTIDSDPVPNMEESGATIEVPVNSNAPSLNFFDPNNTDPNGAAPPGDGSGELVLPNDPQELQAMVAELHALLTADQRVKADLAQERDAYAEGYRNLEAKVAEQAALLASGEESHGAAVKERDELAYVRREHEAALAELEARLTSEREAKESAQNDRTKLQNARRELEARVAELTSRATSDKGVAEHALKKRDEFNADRHQLEAKIADLESRWASEKKAREGLVKTRDELNDARRELEAKIADLDSRLKSERDAKEASQRKVEELRSTHEELDAKVADLESRISSGADSEAAITAERDRLAEQRKAVEAKAADLFRRLANEKEARETAQADRNAMAESRKELEAKIADLSTRLKSESADKEAVRSERDEAMERADKGESLALQREMEFSRYRKSAREAMDKLMLEHSEAMGRMAERTQTLLSNAASIRKRLLEETAAQEKLEGAALELRVSIEAKARQISERMGRVLSDGGSDHPAASAPVAVTQPAEDPEPAEPPSIVEAKDEDLAEEELSAEEEEKEKEQEQEPAERNPVLIGAASGVGLPVASLPGNEATENSEEPVAAGGSGVLRIPKAGEKDPGGSSGKNRAPNNSLWNRMFKREK